MWTVTLNYKFLILLSNADAKSIWLNLQGSCSLSPNQSPWNIIPIMFPSETLPDFFCPQNKAPAAYLHIRTSQIAPHSPAGTQNYYVLV